MSRIAWLQKCRPRLPTNRTCVCVCVWCVCMHVCMHVCMYACMSVSAVLVYHEQKTSSACQKKCKKKGGKGTRVTTIESADVQASIFDTPFFFLKAIACYIKQNA